MRSPTIQSVGNGPDDGNIVRAVDSPWAARLRTLHREVRRTVASASRTGTGTTNAKGDDVRLFDLAANDAALAVFQSFQMPLVVDSEESGHLEIGSGTPRHRLVLDPVDGSDNWVGKALGEPVVNGLGRASRSRVAVWKFDSFLQHA